MIPLTSQASATLPTSEFAQRPPVTVLHVIIDLAIGGAELMLKRLIASYENNNPSYRHEVVSLRGLSSLGTELQAMGVEVHSLGMWRAVDVPRTMIRLVSLIRSRKPDIVQTWMYHADLIGGLSARFAGVKRIIWGVRIADIGPNMGVSRATPWIRRVCAILSRSVPQKIIYVANSARIVHEQLGYASTKSVFIPNGYLLPALADLPVRRPLRAELGLPPDAVLIGSAGRYNAQKDHRTFFHAAAKVADCDPRACFVLMGRGVESNNAEIAQLVAGSGHADRFHLLGERRDILDCLASLDIFCLHSVQEGFPNAVAEAMSVGVPCVSTDVGDAALLIGETGKLAPPRNAQAICDALLELVQAGEHHRERLGRMARQRITENFSMDAARKRFEAVYEEVLGPPHPSAGSVQSLGNTIRAAPPAADERIDRN